MPETEFTLTDNGLAIAETAFSIARNGESMGTICANTLSSDFALIAVPGFPGQMR